MAIAWTQTQIRQMATCLNDEYETAEEAAQAALDLAEQFHRDRARFSVVGQLLRPKTSVVDLHPSDPEAIKMSLGFYSTESHGRTAAESWYYNTLSGDVWRTWVLPVWHGTPAELHREQRQKYEQAEQRAKEKLSAKIQAQIEKRRAEMQRIADEWSDGRAA